MENIDRFKDIDEVFEKAISEGRLSLIPASEYFAYDYAYMGSWDGRDQFKDTIYRRYLP